jgi:RimJ/RimL family protein N-acetyltransferase
MQEALDGLGFETKRLCVALVSGSDLDAKLVAETESILSEDVTAFLPPQLHFHPQSDGALEWLTHAMQEGVLLKVQGWQEPTLLGFVLLGSLAADDVHIGYLLAERAWGQGYASELVQGLVAHLRRTGRGGRAIGGVSPDNVASAWVLIKAGFVPSSETAPDGSVFYHIDLGSG